MNQIEKIIFQEIGGEDVFSPRHCELSLSDGLSAVEVEDEREYGETYNIPGTAGHPYTVVRKKYNIIFEGQVVGEFKSEIYWHGGINSGHEVVDDYKPIITLLGVMMFSISVKNRKDGGFEIILRRRIENREIARFRAIWA